MTNKEMISEALKTIREDPRVYETCADGFTARDVSMLIYSDHGVRIPEQEITAELLTEESVEIMFRLKWEPSE